MNEMENIHKFINVAHIHKSFTCETENLEDYKTANKAYDEIMQLYEQLKQSDYGIALLRSQIYNPDDYVASWAAALLINEYTKECKKVIKRIMKGKGLLASDTEMFYKEWKKGHIKW